LKTFIAKKEVKKFVLTEGIKTSSLASSTTTAATTTTPKK